MPSANLELVRSIYADWGRGDFGSAEWADPEIEVVIADGPSPGRWSGLAGMAERRRATSSGSGTMCADAEEHRALDRDEVLVLDYRGGRGTTSDLELGQMRTHGATVWRVRDGRVTRLVIYFNRERAPADLGFAWGEYRDSG
jgi:ketosteroid isomerase-like protein